MPKLDLDSIEATNRTGYPPPYDREVQGRWQRPLGGGYSDIDMMFTADGRYVHKDGTPY